jgi:hypothetical protein
LIENKGDELIVIGGQSILKQTQTKLRTTSALSTIIQTLIYGISSTLEKKQNGGLTNKEMIFVISGGTIH